MNGTSISATLRRVLTPQRQRPPDLCWPEIQCARAAAATGETDPFRRNLLMIWALAGLARATAAALHWSR